MKLENALIASAVPREKPYKLFDGGGLFLLVMPHDNKYWRLKYRFGGKEKQAALGIYPDVSLDEARLKADALRGILAGGVDPGEYAKQQKALSRDEEARHIAATRFTLGNDGALALRLGTRCISLTPDETKELRRFLDATCQVNPEVPSCP